MPSKVINTILNLKDNFSDTVSKVAQNTSSFRSGMQKTESQAISMKKTVSDAFGTIKESMLHGIGLGAGMDIWESMKDSIVETVSFGNDFKKSLNGVMASSGLAETGMDRMKNVMLDIYNDNFGENFQDIGDALKDVGQQTGYTGDDLKSLTENALALRDTFGFDVSESTRSASMLMKQFGIDGNEAFNLIAQGKQSGVDFSGEMLDSIDEYSVQFKKLGLNAEDMFNIFSSGSANGAFNLDKVGDAVKEFSVRAIDGSNTTTDGFTQLGFNANDLSAKFAKGGATAKSSFKDVVNALTNMKDPLKQSQVGVELFGTQFEDLGIAAISNLADINGDISNTYDALGLINGIKYNDIGSAFEGIKRNIQTGILIPISDEVLPRLQDFSQWFVSNIPSIKESVLSITNNFLGVAGSILDKNLPAVQNLGGAISDLATIIWNSIQPAFDSIKPTNWNDVADAIKDIIDRATGVVNYIKDNWPTIKPIIEDITEAIIAWKLATIAVNGWIAITTITVSGWETIELIIWGIVNATSAWEAIQWALNVAMDANLVGVIILAIAALGVAIYEVITHWETIWNWINKVWDVINSNPILLFISYAINPLGTVLMELVTHWKDVCEWVGNAWDWLTKWNGTEAKDKNVTITKTEKNAFEKATEQQATTTSFGMKIGPANATGTQYWSGGATRMNEYGNGEMAILPSGSKVIPAGQTDKMLSNGNGGIHLYLTIQGNVIGNEQFANQVGQHVYNQIQLSMINSK